MKEKIIEFFQNELPSSKPEQFNRLFEFYRQSAGKSVASERMYNASGYSMQNLEALKYDLQKIYGIKDSELMPRKKADANQLSSTAGNIDPKLRLFILISSFTENFNIDEELETQIIEMSEEAFILQEARFLKNNSQLTYVDIIRSTRDGESPEVLELLEKIFKAFPDVENQELKGNDEKTINTLDVIDATAVSQGDIEKQESGKLREEFSFLNEKDCPDIAHVLVGRKIAAWIRYKANHEKLQQSEAGVIKLSDEEKTQLAKAVVEDFEENQSIYDELNSYKENKEFLKTYPLFRTLRLKEEVENMSADQLIKFKSSSVKYFSDNNKKLKAEGLTETAALEINKRIEERQEKLNLVNEKLGVQK